MLAFLVIAVAEGLFRAAEVAAVEAGPEYVTADPGYPALITAAGFVDVDLTDVTPEYAETAAAWFTEWRRETDDLESLLGRDEFQDRQARRENALEAIEGGLLKRYLITAHAPG